MANVARNKNRRQSLATALRRAYAGQSDALRCGLDGCPVGGWPETQQALRRIEEALPLRSERSYTVKQFVGAAYTVDHADRYRVRDEVAS